MKFAGIAKDQKFQFPRAPSEKSLEVASDEDQLSKDSPWKPIETEVCGEALSVEEKYHIAAAYSDKNSYHIATGTGVHCICSPLRQQASHGCFFSLAGAGAHEGPLHHRVFFSCTAPGLLHMDVPNGAECT